MLLPSNGGIIVNTATPGLTVTSLMRNTPLWFKLLATPFYWYMARSSDEGSRILIWATLAGIGNKPVDVDLCDRLRGAYISGEGIVEPADVVLGESGVALGLRLWVRAISSQTQTRSQAGTPQNETIDELQKVDPIVKSILREYFPNH
jgi:hypothetical protein